MLSLLLLAASASASSCPTRSLLPFHKAANGTALLSRPVFYGRLLLRLPAESVLAPVKSAFAQESGLSRRSRDVLSLALAVLQESRRAESPHKEWLELVQREQPVPALLVTAAQRLALAGTSVERLPEELQAARQLLVERADCSSEEADWALSAVLRHAHAVLLEGGESALRIAAAPELLGAERQPDEAAALEERNGTLLRRARRDMKKGEALPFWTGRLSNSELKLCSGGSFEKNPCGIGGELLLPENWNPRASTLQSRAYGRFNCTAEAFELRLSPKGWPGRRFVRCSRIAWFLANDWYKEEYAERLPLLDKWPPPAKYKHEEWLGWTQADQAVNEAILSYCSRMKKQLKESITKEVAESFRRSEDALEQLLWLLRVEESKSFSACVSLARSVSTRA